MIQSPLEIRTHFMKSISILLLAVISLGAQTAESRHNIRPNGAVRLGGSPRESAEQYLKTTAAQSYARSPLDIAGMYMVKQYRTEHNGVTHFIYRQQFQGVDVQGSDFTINVDSAGAILNSGGMIFAAPPDGVGAPAASSAARALRAAIQKVRGRNAPADFMLITAPEARKNAVRLARPAAIEQFDGEPVWFFARGALRPAWRFFVSAEDGVDNFETIVDSESGRVLGKDNLTWYQSPKGMVFGQSPQPNPAPGVALTAAPAYVNRTSQSFAGDPAASPSGWVTSNSTAGNNVVAAPNPMGIRFLSPNQPAVAENGDFNFPLELGPGHGAPGLYSAAATTNLFYWANRAHDFFYMVGFDEQAGNYQQGQLLQGWSCRRPDAGLQSVRIPDQQHRHVEQRVLHHAARRRWCARVDQYVSRLIQLSGCPGRPCVHGRAPMTPK